MTNRYKSLALRLSGRMLLGEVVKGKNKKLESKYGIGEDLPRLIVVPARADGQTEGIYHPCADHQLICDRS